MILMLLSQFKVLNFLFIWLHWRRHKLLDGWVEQCSMTWGTINSDWSMIVSEQVLHIICCCKSVEVLRKIVWRLTLTLLKLNSSVAAFKFERSIWRLLFLSTGPLPIVDLWRKEWWGCQFVDWMVVRQEVSQLGSIIDVHAFWLWINLILQLF